jgi:hypothetical protein
MFKRGKKGQVALFVIIAIIIVAVALLLVYEFKPNFSQVFQGKEDPIVQEVRAKIDSQVQKATYDSLYLIGKQGGYIELPENSLITDKQSIAYSLYFDKNNLPSLNNIQMQISNYIEKTLSFYFEDDHTFDNLEYSVKLNLNQTKVNTKIQNKITNDVNLITTISKNNKTIIIKKYLVEVPFNFEYVYNVAEEIVSRKLNNLPIDESFFQGKDVSVEVFPIDSSTTLYRLKYFDQVNQQDFIFNVVILKNG